jgi:hypothetical protein
LANHKICFEKSLDKPTKSRRVVPWCQDSSGCSDRPVRSSVTGSTSPSGSSSHGPWEPEYCTNTSIRGDALRGCAQCFFAPQWSLEFSHILLTFNMPHIHTSVVSSSHFQPIVIRALKRYKERTKDDLFAHPLAAQLRACNSPSAILLVLQQQIQVHNRSRCSHERLTHCLDPTVNVLYTFSRVLEDGVGLVCFRTWF